MQVNTKMQFSWSFSFKYLAKTQGMNYNAFEEVFPLPNYLADRRKELGITQKEVADYVGVSEATVSRWESGAIANMRRDRINLYAKILRTRPSFIMTGEQGSESEERVYALTSVEWSRVQKMRTVPPAILEAIDKLLE